MHSILPDSFGAIFNLAKAREILLLEAKSRMPPGAAAQRAQMLAALESVIHHALLQLDDLPPPPAARDVIGAKAWKFVSSLHIAEHTVPEEPPSDYAVLQACFEARTYIGLTAQILQWIQSTHAMPDLSGATLEDAISATEIFSHRLITSENVKESMHALLEDNDELDETGRRNFALMKREYFAAAGVPESLVDDISRASLASFRVWEKAKPKSDFDNWLPHLEEIVTFTRQKADILGEALDVTPYQALLENYNPGLRNETVNRIFADMQEELPQIIARISAQQSAEAPLIPLPSISVDVQRRIVSKVMQSLGFDAQFSRLDDSMHPFSTGEWDDVRITTHYKEERMLSGLMGVIHEMGHMFYSRALPRKWQGQPIGAAQSMWIHESQSLFWEKQVACSKEFITFLAPVLQAELGNDPAWHTDNLYRHITRVAPGLIRIEADEVTYPTHIILRHKLEQQLVLGTLAPKDLPAAWAEQMQTLLNIAVPDHAHGVMQDVHWTDGSFGYFPAYTFGALAAAQIMEAIRIQLPDVDTLIASGNFAPLLHWLEEHIHSQGSYFEGEELLEHATGESLSVQPWLRHIKARYLAD